MIAMYAMQAMAHSHTAEVVGLITASAAMKSTASAEAKTVAVDAAAASHKAAATSVEATASHKAATSVETAASHKAATSVETAASHKSATAAAVAAPASASLSRRHGADRCERQGARSEQALESMFDRYMHDSFSVHSLIVPPLLAGRFRSVLQTSSDMIDSRRLDVLHHGQKRLRDLHWRASHFTVDEEHQPARFALDLREDRSIAIR
jgi:hypothetical protein